MIPIYLSHMNLCLRLPLTDDQAGVLAAQSERVGQRYAHRLVACDVGNVVQVAVRIWCFIVDGRMNRVAADREGNGQCLDGASGAKTMADHALGAADGQPVGVSSEHS